jgi:hypothetical protein
MKIRPVEAELFYVDRQTDGHDEANSRFRNFSNMPKNVIIQKTAYSLVESNRTKDCVCQR